ncbi:hypothetical protein GCM10009756_18690 [Pseudokineococcus marinus]
MKRLGQVAADLHEVGVVTQVATLARSTWSTNLERHEPELGDTPLLLGLQCAENLAQRVHRHYRALRPAPGSHGPASGTTAVTVSFVERALIVKAAGVELQLRKAPAGGGLVPDWAAMSHADGVHRLAAADANSLAYRPEASDQDGRPSTLPSEDALWPLGDAGALRQVSLVWAGTEDGARTSGWLGFPSSGDIPWFAVQPLWWDEAGQDPGSRRRESSRTSDGFADRPAPTPVLRPRTQPRESEGA